MYGRTFCTFEAKDKTVGLKGRLIKESFFVCSFEKKVTAAGLSLHEKTKLGTEEAFFLLLLSFPLGDIIVKASPISKVNFLCAPRNIELGYFGGASSLIPPSRARYANFESNCCHFSAIPAKQARAGFDEIRRRGSGEGGFKRREMLFSKVE